MSTNAVDMNVGETHKSHLNPLCNGHGKVREVRCTVYT